MQFFCTDCVETALSDDNRYPECKELQGVVKGNQPDGQMHVYHSQQLFQAIAVIIKWSHKDGIPLSDLGTIVGPIYSSLHLYFYFPVDVLKMVIFVWDNYIHIGFGISLSFGLKNPARFCDEIVFNQIFC